MSIHYDVKNQISKRNIYFDGEYLINILNKVFDFCKGFIEN